MFEDHDCNLLLFLKPNFCFHFHGLLFAGCVGKPRKCIYGKSCKILENNLAHGARSFFICGRSQKQ